MEALGRVETDKDFGVPCYAKELLGLTGYRYRLKEWERRMDGDAETEAAAGPERVVLLPVPGAMVCPKEHFDSVLAVLHIPDGYQKRLWATNLVERVNQELKHRGRAVRIWSD